ncbi:hypothetical protein ZWY2020_007834 [Hordeum vulgare]|nr:hypothetical protein ZWY2020_007834 [Hordeum vulgare]
MHTERISNGVAMEFDVHLVETHMRKMDLTMVYTNDPVMVEDSTSSMEWLIAEDDKYIVVGFDLAYTCGRVGHDQKVVVVQLCMHHHVLLYHYCVATVPCECFIRFVNSPDYRFVMVDNSNDRKVLKTLGLDCQKLVDICVHYKIWGSKKDMDLTKAIVDPYYEVIKAQCKKNKLVWHMAWVKRLDEHHFQTVTKEAYTCYEMFRRIVDMRNYLLPEYVEGSSHKQRGGGKCERK